MIEKNGNLATADFETDAVKIAAALVVDDVVGKVNKQLSCYLCLNSTFSLCL